MQNLSDKELDDLFKSKLENAAVAPPGSLWSAIEKEIQPRPKRRWPIYGLAAAVALFALMVGLHFTQHEKIPLRGKNEIVNTKEIPSVQTQPVVPQLSPLKEEVVTPTTPLQSPVADKGKNEKKNLRSMQPLTAKVHQTINEAKEQQNKVEELSVVTTVIPEEPLIIAQVPDQSRPGAVAISEEEPDVRTGIRNVGDLVNFVVDKVDKREKKFLKFKTDDDDNSELVAINIGIIKFNPREK